MDEVLLDPSTSSNLPLPYGLVYCPIAWIVVGVVCVILREVASESTTRTNKRGGAGQPAKMKTRQKGTHVLRSRGIHQESLEIEVKCNSITSCETSNK